jgi:hypothetical protein
MNCPLCKKEIDSVNVISRCWQVAELDGNKIVEYGSVEEIYPANKIECPKCLGDITKYIKV